MVEVFMISDCMYCGRIPTIRYNLGYSITCDECYDGAVDSPRRSYIALGRTQGEAINAWNNMVKNMKTYTYHLTEDEKELIDDIRRDMIQVRKLEDFSSGEKIAAFDRFFGMAREEYEFRKDNSDGIKDMSHYMYEEVMKLLHPDIFKLI